MKKFKKIMALTIAFVMILTSTVFAAVPNNSIVVGGKAVSTDYLFNDVNGGQTLINELLDANQDEPVFVQLDGQYDEFTNVFTGQTATDSELDKVTKYINADGVEEDLDNNDGELEVVEVSAINTDKIKVIFDAEVDTVNAANFSISKGIIKSANVDVTNRNIVNINVEGLNYGDTAELTVLNVTAGTAKIVSYAKGFKVPEFGEIYKVELTSEKAEILADGLSKTMVTAKILNKVTNEYVKEEGLVSFTTTKGAFAQPEVSFDQNGVAALQLTSEVSTSVITAYLTATITSVPGATEYEGLVGQLQVKFTTTESSGELQLVNVVAASSKQADRINVEFNDPVTVAEILGQYTTFAAAKAANFGFEINGYPDSLITDIVQDSAKIITLILDTDNYFVQGTTGTTELRYDYLTTTGSNYDAQADTNNVAFNGAFLRDNMTHNIAVPSNGTKVLASPAGVNFVLTDTSKPWIKGVNVVSQMEIELIFSEAMAEDIAELTETNASGHILYKNFRIDGKRLMPIAGTTSTLAERSIATNNNYLLVKDVYVNGYWDGPVAADRRNIVTVSIDSWNKLAPGEYSVQASNVGDWAAMTHNANMLETQTFDFEVEGNNEIPKVTIEVHSPEQWLLTFDKPVKTLDTKALQDAIKIYTREEYAETVPSALTMTDATAPVKHYQVTAVDAQGLLVGGTTDGFAPAAGVTGVQRLLIEFKQDWTIEYDTANTEINYFHSTKSPYVVVLDHWVDEVTENAMEKTVLTAATPLDAKSPEIKNARDVFDLAGKSIRGVLSTLTGQFVFVEMDEPVQLRNATNSVVTTPITESQQQLAGAGIPIPTFEFVKGDDVIPGSLVAGSIPQDDFDFVVKPDRTLAAGTWTLIIRSISDDVGNTSATVTRNFIVKEAGPVAQTDTRVSWIGFDNAKDDYDYIFVKFTKEMKSTSANGVARTTNYSLNNNPLPSGSEIIKGIKNWEGNAAASVGNVTNDWDGVTIKMPKTAWDGTLIDGSIDYTLVFGVASNFESTGGETLAGPYTVQLSHEDDNSTNDADFDFEALYLNLSVNNLVLADLIAGAEATDTDTDGEIETITLYDRAGLKVIGAPDHTILVNGVKFVSDGTDYLAAAPIKTTDSSGFKITSTTGAIIINTGNVIDLAAPVIIKVKGQVGNKEVIVTFSEKVTHTTLATQFADTDFAYNDVSGGNASDIVSLPTHYTPLTQLSVVLDVVVDATDINADTIDIAGTNIVDLAATPNSAVTNPIVIK